MGRTRIQRWHGVLLVRQDDYFGELWRVESPTLGLLGYVRPVRLPSRIRRGRMQVDPSWDALDVDRRPIRPESSVLEAFGRRGDAIEAIVADFAERGRYRP